jgi:hypothetical protein
MGSAFSTIPAVRAEKASQGQTSPTFVWLYGYVGGEFYPTTELGITQAQVLHEASALSDSVGRANLRLVTAVDEVPEKTVNGSMIPVVKEYVDSLEKHASVVYGRIDLRAFNLTSTISVYQKVGEYVNQMDLNGIWFDHAVVYYSAVGGVPFNSMMQNLSTTFPQLNFILNNAAIGYGIIAPGVGDTWQTNTYISPTVKPGTYEQVNLATISSMFALYPNHVLLHFDAYANDTESPMGIFADQNAATEIGAISALAAQGTHPVTQSQAYSLLYPIMGAWTCLCSLYQGTIYNSLLIGMLHRGTAHKFASIMAEP